MCFSLLTIYIFMTFSRVSCKKKVLNMLNTSKFVWLLRRSEREKKEKEREKKIKRLLKFEYQNNIFGGNWELKINCIQGMMSNFELGCLFPCHKNRLPIFPLLHRLSYQLFYQQELVPLLKN